MKYVPKGEDRPRIAIETAENWVRGKATKNQVKKASDAAYVAADEAFSAAAYAVAYAAAASANAATWAAAAYAAWAAEASFETEIRRFVDVTADAIMTFPQKRAKTTG